MIIAQVCKVDPDLDCSHPKRQTAPRAEEIEEDSEMILETQHEEDEEERALLITTLMIPLTKKRKNRQTVKEENVSITALMIEVSGPDGPIMVFRPWTVNDMKEVMAQFTESGGNR